MTIRARRITTRMTTSTGISARTSMVNTFAIGSTPFTWNLARQLFAGCAGPRNDGLQEEPEYPENQPIDKHADQGCPFKVMDGRRAEAGIMHEAFEWEQEHVGQAVQEAGKGIGRISADQLQDEAQQQRNLQHYQEPAQVVDDLGDDIRESKGFILFFYRLSQVLLVRINYRVSLWSLLIRRSSRSILRILSIRHRILLPVGISVRRNLVLWVPSHLYSWLICIRIRLHLALLFISIVHL